MTKARAQYLYHLTGLIQKKHSKKPSPRSQYAGQSYYDLAVQLEPPYQHIKTIQVFKNKLAQEKIWTTIESKPDFHSQYLFHCRNQRGHFYLVDWEEVA